MFTPWRMPKFGSHGLTGARGPPQAPQHMSITDNVYAKE